MAENILEVRHLKKWFKIGNPAIKKVGVSYLHACDDVSFDAYSEAVNAARQLKMQSEAEIKRAEEEKAYKENKARQYRSKEQRAADAQKRNRIRELEKEIEDTEVLIFELENAISDPEIASDYSKMSEKCKELEEAKTALDQKMDEWAELSDQLS